MGSYEDIHIELKNFPIRVESDGLKKELYPEFNTVFIEELWKKVGKFSEFHERLAVQRTAGFLLLVRNAPAFEVKIFVKDPFSLQERQFYDHVTEAIIAAFKSRDIRR